MQQHIIVHSVNYVGFSFIVVQEILSAVKEFQKTKKKVDGQEAPLKSKSASTNSVSSQPNRTEDSSLTPTQRATLRKQQMADKRAEELRQVTMNSYPSVYLHGHDLDEKLIRTCRSRSL